jgi:hypothetical protein
MAGSLGLDELFEGRHFDREIIVLCVRSYLRFKLSFRDLVEMMAERGLSMAHTTVMRWVHHYALEFERRWNRFARPAGPSWRVDESCAGVASQAVRSRNGPTHRLLAVGLCDLPHELGPGHVHRAVNCRSLGPRVVLEDFHHQRGVVGQDHAGLHHA